MTRDHHHLRRSAVERLLPSASDRHNPTRPVSSPDLA